MMQRRKKYREFAGVAIGGGVVENQEWIGRGEEEDRMPKVRKRLPPVKLGLR